MALRWKQTLKFLFNGIIFFIEFYLNYFSLTLFNTFIWAEKPILWKFLRFLFWFEKFLSFLLYSVFSLRMTWARLAIKSVFEEVKESNQLNIYPFESCRCCRNKINDKWKLIKTKPFILLHLMKTDTALKLFSFDRNAVRHFILDYDTFFYALHVPLCLFAFVVI